MTESGSYARGADAAERYEEVCTDPTKPAPASAPTHPVVPVPSSS